MNHKITSYNSGWSLSGRRGTIIVKLENGQSKMFNFSDAGDFTAVLMILQGDNDPMYSENRNSIYTGVEIPGDA